MKTAEEWAKEMPQPLGQVFLQERSRVGTPSAVRYGAIEKAIDGEISWYKTLDERFWSGLYEYLGVHEKMPPDILKKTLEYKRKLDKVCKQKSDYQNWAHLAC